MTHQSQQVQLPKSSIIRKMDVSSASEKIEEGTKGHVRFNGRLIALEYRQGTWQPQK